MREFFQKNRYAGFAVAGTFLAMAALIVWMTTEWSPRVITKCYFTNDDGQTWFIDDVDRVTPFDKDGKPAVRAYLFSCPSGKSYCGLVSRHSDSGREAVAIYRIQHPDGRLPESLLRSGSREFKQPGQTKWVNDQSGDMFKVSMQKACSDGTYPVPFLP